MGPAAQAEPATYPLHSAVHKEIQVGERLEGRAVQGSSDAKTASGVAANPFISVERMNAPFARSV